MNTLKDSRRAESAVDSCSFISRYFHWYLNPLYREGNKRQLQSTDVYKISKRDEAGVVSVPLSRLWLKEQDKSKKNQKKGSFPKAVFKYIYSRWLLLVLGFATIDVLRLSNTIFLKKTLDSLSNDLKENRTDSYYWGGAVSAVLVITWLVHHKTMFESEVLGINVQSAILSLVYGKALQISQVRLGEISTGHVVTIFASDAQKFQKGLKLTPFLIVGPFSAIVGIALLWNEIGPSCLAGVAVLLFFVPLQYLSGKCFAKLRSKALKLTDNRISKMNEIISSMQITKMFAWEESFSQQVREARKLESRQILKAAMLKALNSATFSSAPYVMVFATFATYYYGDGEITIGKVYFAISVFAAIKIAVMHFVPLGVQMGMEFYISCKRVEQFLLEDNMENIEFLNVKHKSASIELINVVASWEGGTLSSPVINNVSFKADQDNNAVMICGPVGSGKTSLLLAVLHEMKIKSGKVTVEGKLAYAAQQPWIFSGTIRQNILFGQEYDDKRFHKVVEACALVPDLDSFKKREYTLVGERGVSLSGGQKARIGLARAVYSDANIYLLDDPLSAVDTKVGKYIFQRCIKDLLKEKVVVLVTHQTQYLEGATQKIIFKADDKQSTSRTIDILFDEKEIDTENDDKDSSIDLNDCGSSSSSHSDGKKTEKKDDGGEKEEFRKQGRVSFDVYVSYFFKGVGVIATLFLYVAMVLCQASLTFTDYWLGKWAQGEDKRRTNKSVETRLIFEDNPDKNIYLFAGFIGVIIVLSFFSSGYLFAVMIRCSRELHNRMFARVLKAPMYFFDTNPVGQILNRFSGDIHHMDDELPYAFSDFAKLTIMSLAIIILNCINVPYLTILVVIMLVLFLYFRNYFLSTARDVKRIEACDRSPMFTHVSATLSGIITIRAFNIQKKIYDEFINCLDYQAESELMFHRCVWWFGQRLDFGVVLFSIVSIFLPIVIATHTDEIDTGLIGVTFIYLLQLCGMFQYCIQQSAEVDNLMTSVERVQEYTKLEIEEESSNLMDVPKGDWVVDGSIQSIGTSYAYHKSLPNVLHNINFNINPMEKIGIVGRTGAGKSTLISMLFRLGKSDGCIQIDGHDINRIPLNTLRKAISVIPQKHPMTAFWKKRVLKCQPATIIQDPMLFTGPLRKNLDPFNEHTDEAIWNALKEVEMKKSVQNFNRKLDTEIAESGANISVGERQLLCLARALLKKNKILLVDEATANVDNETDALIQKTIRSTFKQCTVLTIAHRINTVMDSDRIMVMDDGNIVEFDTPEQLLQIPNGFFRKLVDEMGEQESKRLKSFVKR